ncbi:phytase [Methylocucumis oryzae]|uniref:BPP domain-containing protein n=1 Tax=Methylocucumis oryzae TaxID=1632867 RepID=A0A0F3IKU1_9GAMM|nr:phytase [Methylocucumis oryzae]KJV07336.1 hypothetical protein VZ94_05435 [Methylocucumis oryzae]
MKKSCNQLLMLSLGMLLMVTNALAESPAPSVVTTMANVTVNVPILAPSLTASVETPVLHQYDDAPLTPDADDPAIWRNSANPKRSLVIASLKDAGLQVYNLQGKVLQTIYPANHPAVTEQDPPVPGLTSVLAATATCKGSTETYGRFNNVDVVYGVNIPKLGQVDLALATDRGCDMLRVFVIDPSKPNKPLQEITDTDAPRVFNNRIFQPSSYQPASDHEAGESENPVDEQNTAYGLTVFKDGNKTRVFVSQRSRSRLVELVLRPTKNGTVSYRVIRDYRFPVVHDVPASTSTEMLHWEACREDPNDDLQFEGLAVDARQGILYASQELIGVWKLPIARYIPDAVEVINVSDHFLMEKVKTFAMPYAAIPDGDEFECEYGDTSSAPSNAIIVPGNAAFAGQHIEADAEGISVVDKKDGTGYVIVSSQGNDTLQVYAQGNLFSNNVYLGEVTIEGVAETDGVHVVAQPFSKLFPDGLMVVHNGGAVEPEDTSDINGYEYDGSTQFKYINFKLPF